MRGFRTAQDVAFEPQPLCALVGGPLVGKSNLLAAVLRLLSGEPADGEVRGRLASGEEVGPHNAPSVLFLPAADRAGGTAPLELVESLEERCERGDEGLVLLVEEPELYLRPQAQRYLYRLFRRFAECGNQVIYSTHSPAFLNLGRLDEIVYVDRLPRTGTKTHQAAPFEPGDEFRVMTEFDAERAELFLARAAVLVEGDTEKLSLPFVFTALGEDADRSAISIVECGGKSNIPLFARICEAVGVPAVAVHDRDSSGLADRKLNGLIAETLGDGRVFVLDPDFEAIADVRGKGHKPRRAWQHFASLSADEMPRTLVDAVQAVLVLAGDA